MTDKRPEILERFLKQEETGRILYNGLFLNNYSIMLLIDPENGVIIDANPSAIEFYGYSREELLNTNIMEINTLSAEAVKKEMIKAAAENRNRFFFRHRKKSGEVRDVEVYSSPLYIDSKKLLFSIVSDISDYLELVESRRRTKSKLSRIQSELKELRGVIPVCSYCKRIRDDKGAWDSLEEYIRVHSDSMISHGICPECFEKEKKLIEDFRSNKN